ncbi:MAG: hypothetical protein KKH01_00795 [Firmicutes bacterium]|nr:hypothetical protein [Bacillota bacterium]
MEFETFKVITTILGVSEFEFEYNNKEYSIGHFEKNGYFIADKDNILAKMDSVIEVFDSKAFDGKTLEEIWYSIITVYWDGLGDADNWFNQLIGDDLFELINMVYDSRYNKEKFDYWGTLHKLFKMENEGKIVLYAGTYSLANAIEKVDTEEASFYIYEKNHRIGFSLYINRMGSSFVLDKNIFKNNHKRLYKRIQLSNILFGEPDQRKGEFFNMKKSYKLLAFLKRLIKR